MRLLKTACIGLGIFYAPMSWAAGPTQDELDRSATSTETWLMTNKSYDGQRFVRLSEINTSNVSSLKEVCTYDSKVDAPAQSSPLLFNGMLFFTAGQTTVAVDAASCREVWRHEWTLKAAALSKPNRGVAIKDGRVVRGTSDGFLIALNIDDGKLIWERQIARAEDGYYLSMPAMIVGDTIIYGTAGADWGGRGWMGGFSLADGNELWRFNALPAPGEPGSESWGSAEALAHGGGSFWTPISVDRAANVVYIAVGNPAPDFFGGARPGTNSYTNALVALDIATGKPQFSRQFVPHDIHDWDLTQTSPLLTIDVDGKKRDIVFVSGKDGRVRVVDRRSGDVLSDLAISKQENGETELTEQGVHVCPGLLGGQEWSSSAYEPKLGLVISPMVDWCGVAKRDKEQPQWKVSTHFYGGKIDQDPINQAKGVLAAMSLSPVGIVWKLETSAPMLANVTTTSGGLVFAGDLNGKLYAVDSATGAVIHTVQLPGSAGGGLLSYQVAGHQHIAAVSGSVSAFFGGKGGAKITVFALP